MPPFDPDAYLKEDKPSAGFDPDAYLNAPDVPAFEQAADRIKPQPSFLEDVGSGLKGLVSGPVGEGLPVIGPLASKAAYGARAGISTLSDLGSDVLSGETKSPEDYLNKLTGEYQRVEADDRARLKDYQEKYPVSSTIKSFAEGMALPAPANVAKGVGIGAQAANALGRVAGNTATVAADTALRGGDYEGAATTGALLGTGLEGLGAAGRAIGKVAPRAVFGVSNELMDKYKARAPEINQTSREAVKDALDLGVSRLRDEASELSSGAASRLDDALSGFRKNISQQSTDAFNVLEGSGSSFPVASLKDQISSRLKSQEVAGVIPNNSATSVLRRYEGFLDEIQAANPGRDLTGPEVKGFLKLLDDDLQTAYDKSRAVGGYLDSGDRATMGLRRDLSEMLKSEVPEYRAAMEPLSRDTQAMEDVLKYFKGGDKTQSALSSMSRPGRQDASSALSAFQDRAGINVTDDIQRARELEDLVRGITPDSSQAKINQLTSRSKEPIELKRKFEALGEAVGDDFLQKIDDLGVKEAFEKGFTNGSRNVNLGAISLAGIAQNLANATSGATGVIFGPGAAGAMGAALGALNDVAGPGLVKRWLDLSMTPGFQKFEKVLSEAMKRGPRSLITTHELLRQNDPEYQSMTEGT